TCQPIQPIVLHLPQLKRLEVREPCDIFHLVQAAPNLRRLKIDFSCLNIILNYVSTCELLQKRIVYLEIINFHDGDLIQLDTIAQKLNNLRDLSLWLEDPQAIIDSLILQVLLLWKDNNIRCLCIRGLLTDEVSKNLRQWLINHSHLHQENSFFVEHEKNWIVIWLQ
ncbi:unnamed protein product, partial [Rotaria sp. Silwood2]